MSESCSHECSSCASNCGERKEEQSLLAPMNSHSKIKKVIAVMSGKGGVGKSLVTSMLAVTMQRRGFKTAILDADITGPSIPKIFNIKDKVFGDDRGLNPAVTSTGIKIMSTNLILDNETDPVVWRGPILGGVVKQFWSDVNWGEIDYMFIDMPPGTGDVPLTIYQSLPIDGIIVVTTPQELVSMIVEKAVNMAALLAKPIIGLVENMSYFICDNCDKKHYIFGPSTIKEVAARNGISAAVAVPMDPQLAAKCDAGLFEEFAGDYLKDIGSIIEGKHGI